MTNWLIVRTDLAKEQVVARALERMGFSVYCPMELRTHRTGRIGKFRGRDIHEVPLLPKALLADVAPHRETELQRIQYFMGVLRGHDFGAVYIPAYQVQRFREYVEQRNLQIRKQVEASKTKRQKKQWVKLTASNLPELLNKMFGTQEREAA